MKKKLRASGTLVVTACLLISQHYRAYSQVTLNTTINNGAYTAPHSITLGNGFTSTPGPGQSFTAGIALQDCQALHTSPGNYNWIITWVPRIANLANPADTANTTCQVMATVQYFDGLGRPIQTVQVKGSPNGNDLVQPIIYDKFGRESTKYQPYASPGYDGSFKTAALSEQSSFYGSGGDGITPTGFPFAVTNFEQSPAGRPTEQSAPGAAWQMGSGHTVGLDYGVNAASDIRLWTVAGNGNGASSSGYYSGSSTNGVLTANAVTDENGHATITYTDNEGHVVCKKVQSGSSTYLQTDYIYDDMGNLAYVIPPIPSGTTYSTSFSEADPIFANFIYGYHYDGRHRVIEKKVPGKGWEYLVYNDLDKVVATQDSVQRGNNTWTYTKYDALGRTIQSGTWNNGGTAVSQASLQSSVNSNITLWELPAGGGNVYTNNAWPTGSTTLLVLNYYDNYATTYLTALPLAYSAPTGYSTATKGLLTATRTAILNNPGNLLWTVNYYDDFGRVIKTYAQHYLGGSGNLNTNNYDAVTNTYDFTGAVTATTRQHYAWGSLAVTVANTYTYDHMGRKLQTREAVISGGGNLPAPIILSQTDYNEIGQAKIKHLHSINSGASFLQDIAYGYNERGWLKTSTAPLFAMQLNYQDGTTGQWNGNISNQYWGTPGNLNKSYTYSYDPLNRLTDGVSSEGYTESGIGYNELGNITSLTRQGTAHTYSYSGNQLQGVSGITSGTYTYDGNGNVHYDARTGETITYNMFNLPQIETGTINLTYTYDANGQKLRKYNGSVTTDYINGIQYDNGSLSYIQTEEGRAIPSGGSYNYEYSLTDHLGNSRLMFDSHTGTATTVQQDDYYPFGLEINRSVTSPKNEYLYNKKELQEELGQYDYGARFYDPVIGRWTSMDPLAEQGRRWSPYNYAMNSPIRNIDPDGMAVVETASSTTYTESDAVQMAKQYQSQGGDDDPKPTIWERVLSFFHIGTNQPGSSEEGQDKAAGESRLQKASADGDAMEKSADNTWGNIPVISGAYKISKGMIHHSGTEAFAGFASGMFDVYGGEFLQGGVSVIGPRSTYREFAKKIGANFLDVSDEAWTMRKNVQFLQGVVKRGEDVIFSGKYNPKLLEPNSVLGQEIRYLQKNGYSWSKDFTRLIKK